MTANVASWFDFYGQFLYSQPNSNVTFQEASTGNQVVLDQVLFYTGEQSIISAEATLPHTTGSVGALTKVEMSAMSNARLRASAS